MNLDQLRTRDELGTDRAIVLVWTACLRIGPREAAADRRIVRLGMDAADVFMEEDATTAAHTRTPFTPPGPIGHRIAVCPNERERFLVTQRDAVGTASGMMGTRIAWQRWKIAHAAN